MLKMAVQPPPPKTKPEFEEGRVADEELLSVIELAGRKAAAAGFLPVLGAKAKEEQDIMWKLKVRYNFDSGEGESKNRPERHPTC